MFAVFGKYNNKIKVSLLIAVLVILVIGFYSAHKVKERRLLDNQSKINTAVETQLNALSENILKVMDIYSLKLKNMRSYLYGLGLNELSYDSFRKYVLDTEIETNYPGALGFGLIRYVEANDEADFLSQIALDRNELLAVRSLQAHSQARFIVTYIEPEEKNKASLGLDIASEYWRREAAIKAAETAKVTLTAPLKLLQADQQQGFLLLHPVFTDAFGPSQEAKDIFGWVYSPLLMDEIMASISSSLSVLSIQFKDVTELSHVLFFSSEINSDDYDPTLLGRDLSVTKKLYVFGRKWEVLAVPSQRFIDSLNLPSPNHLYFQVLSLFAIAILLLVNGVYFISKRLIEQHQRNELAAVVENGMDGIIGLDNAFCIKYWNDAAKKIFDFDVLSLRMPFLEWLEDNYSADYLIDLFRRIAHGESIKGLELEMVSEDFEHKRFLHLNFQPLIQNKLFLGVSVSVVDLTQLRDLQTQLEEKNMLLNEQLDSRDSQLKATTSLHESLLQGAGYIIISTDMQGTVISANRKFEELLGYDADGFLGKEVTNIFSEQTLQEQKNYLQQAFEHQECDDFQSLVYPLSKQSRFSRELNFLHKNGLSLELQLNISLIKNAEGEAFGYLFMADDLRHEKAMRFDLELMRSAILNSEEILLWLSESGEIVWSNPYALEALGYSEYELNNLRISDVLEFEPGESWEMYIRDLEVNHLPTLDENLLTRQGKSIPCLLMLSELRIEDQRYFFIAAKDISDRLAKERVLEDALNFAAQTNVIKDQFLANMGHELRTPLNEVHGTLQLLEQTSLSGEQLDYLFRAKGSVRLLTQSIGDVLDCGEIIRGRMTFNEETVNLHQLLSDLGQMLAVIAEDKDIQIHFDISPDLPHFIVTDPHRFQQLLMCLLTNAIKFTPRGDVVLRATCSKSEDQMNELMIEVVDSGIGIDADKLEAIFDMFAQIEMGADRSFGGLGLGLTISKHIVEMMSGDIACKSEQGKGSTFTVHVMVGKSQETITTTMQEYPKLSVLVVDDNDIALSVLGSLIAQLGWQADMFSSAAEAECAIREAIANGKKFDLALIDWNMPDKNGLELIKTLRSEFDREDLPVLVMVTAYTRKILEEYDNREMETLLNAFLTKPVTQPVLLDLVSGILNQDLLPVSLSHDMPLHDLNVLLVEDNETNQFIAKNLLRSQGAKVITASDGEKAWQALQDTPDLFDIVLMDIQMPVWDGYRATRQIRLDDRFNNLPILAMTANVLAADKAKCFEAGMNGHIGKPFELGQLVQEILKLVRPTSSSLIQPNSGRSLSSDSVNVTKLLEPNESLKSESLRLLAELSDVDVKLSLQRFGSSESLYVQSLKLFLKDLTGFIDTLEVETEDNFSALKSLFHTLKGTSGLLGFARLSEYAKQCDEEAKKQMQTRDARHLLKGLMHLLKEAHSILEKVFKREAEMKEGNEDSEKSELDRNKLLELVDQLENFNMRATETFQTLEPALRQVDKGRTEKIGDFVASLQFSEAVKELQLISDSLGD